MIPRTMISNEVYLLPLNDDGSPQVQGEYIYIAPKSHDPFTIRFAIEGTSSICRDGSLWVNIPERGVEFCRDKFREFKLVPDFNRTIEISVPVHHPGAFAFYTTYDCLPDLTEDASPSPSSSLAKKESPLYYIDVAPRLKLDGRPLPLPALSIFSVISKFMGQYPNDWELHLRGISDRGYNMIHFTPLQVRGSSNSPYSLYDQLAWDPACLPEGEKDVQKMVDSLEQNHSLLSLTDIVLNHTADNSAWLQEHPEAGYNLTTAPWLELPYLIDTKLLELGFNLEKHGLPTELKSVDDLMKIMDAVKKEVIGAIRMWEYYVINVQSNADEAVESWSLGKTSFPDGSLGPDGPDGLKSASLADQAKFLVDHGLLGCDRMGERYRRKVDPEVAAGLLSALFGRYDGETGSGPGPTAIRQKMVDILDAVNVPFYREYDRDTAEVLEQTFNRIKYVRLDDHGPKLGPIGPDSPLVETYFTRLPRNETTAKHKKQDLVLVNNGWVWAGNALIDNAGPDSRAYLRREVIVWGDCVKLRYGKGPEDSPYLWDRMTKYARMLAKYFAGFRIDNAHSTPIHVAEHILDEARRVRPDLYVCGELFTGSEEMDYFFVKRLGLNSLIREAMQAWSTGEMSRLVHRHGGRPIGSFEVDEISRVDPKGPSLHQHQDGHTANGGSTVHEATDITREIIRRIKPSPIQALFMDCTHDNEVPAQKRDARDTLPNAALVNMCSSATGSVMGYDEIYPKLVDLVSETRLYTSESSQKPVKIGGGKNGIGGIRKLLNQIHTLMGKDGYDETHIHHEDQYITVHRVQPQSRKGYFLIAHTAYPGYGNGNGAFNPVYLTGTRARHLGSWMLEVDASEEAKKAVLDDKKFLRGLPSRVVDLPGIRMEVKDNDTIIHVRDRFPPGSIALFETYIPAAEHSAGLDTFVTSGAKEAFGELDLVDLNFVLYRCEAEERDWSGGKDGVYDIPGSGKLVYAGLQGWWSILDGIIRDNNLAHPLCQNLRDGQWALDYIAGRMERASRMAEFGRLGKPSIWFKERFDAIRGIPSFLLPRYFALVMRTAYMACFEHGVSLMNSNVSQGQWFLKSLAMVSVQQTGVVKSASLYPDRLVPSLAAGLPHFAVEWARCWGRDVFISVRGLFLGTGRYDEAKEHILAFASVLKHGVIPNLLGAGRTPRYNARDSIWFFLQCIQDYTRIVPGGLALLDEKVKRRFLPYDDTWYAVEDPRAYSKESTIREVIQEALQRHASGMSFREANAGPGLDSQMTDKGFNIEIKVDWSTGFVHGGNQDNCGTWMDKMGESEKAGSKGVPGTPRDGAAVEITGLVYSTLKWLSDLGDAGRYPWKGVSKGPVGSEMRHDVPVDITFAEWAEIIRQNFERCFYVPVDPSEDSQHDVNPPMINRRGIYKDLYRSGKEYEDYQLRPNFPIAMTVAPDLFDPAHAMHALCLADRVLRGPQGMATLDPADLNYRPYYRNSEDSGDFATSKGRNYHQGPEWLWPTGFFLRALLKFLLIRCTSSATAVRKKNKVNGDDVVAADGAYTEAFQQVTLRLMGCKAMIRQSPWAGLQELTQKGGGYCADSCPSQAWSAGCLIDLYMDAAGEQARIGKNS